MAFTIITKNSERTFSDKELVNICSKDGFDFKLDVDFDCMLAVQYDLKENKCTILNQFNNPKFLFKGKPLPTRLEVEKVCKVMIDGTDEFITVKVIGETVSKNLPQENLTEEDMTELYGSEVNAGVRLKIEKRKAEIEEARIAITKEVSAEMNNLKNKLSMNSKTGIVLHFAMLFASLVCAFGLSNYIMGLPLKDSANVIQMPTNMKAIFLFMVVIYGVGLMAKQGMFLFLQNKIGEGSVTTKIAEKFMAVTSAVFFVVVYLINTLYYMTSNQLPFFAVLMSLFFVATTVILAVACGYFKHNSSMTRMDLDKYEYRADFEHVVKEYQQWIERFVNSLSHSKLKKIGDTLFTLQIKSVGEIILGICTAPFLAYGVSNTLAMCFPEAAGWIRISSLRFSPVFLVLASVMIVFAFFAFVNAFTCIRKIQGSNVLKQDGFSNYLQHGVEIYGLAGVKRLDADVRRSFAIGITIIVIEFTMNVSYFMQEMGSDLWGMTVSLLGALVPTAILIAETYMLSNTKFECFACDELLAKVDKD